MSIFQGMTVGAVGAVGGNMTSTGSMPNKDLQALQDMAAARRDQRASITQEQAAGGAENLARLQSLKTRGQVGRQPVELTNVPPAPAAASAMQPVFNEPAKQNANQIFGDLFARQNAVGAPLMFKINKFKK